ncbi:MAG: ABC transporter permease [Cytophagaceae bacterium]|nr:ABC transporter permease [Gemmatimonadaceae bacterium]
MPDARWRKVLRDVWEHKARTLLVILAMMVGLAGAGTILDAWALVQRATEEGYLSSDPVAATLRTDIVDSALLATVRTVPGVRDAQARRTVIARALVGGAWRAAWLFTADDLAGRRIGKLRGEAGAWPPPAGAFVIERSSVSYAGTGVGDSVTLNFGAGELRSIPVAGIARDVSLAPGWMEHVVYGFATPATLASLGVNATLTDVVLVVDEAHPSQASVRRIAFAVKAAIEATGHPVHDVDVPVPGEHIHAAQMNSLLYTQGAFGLLALVVCGFLVVNLMAAMLAGQVREIGVMKTLGASGGQLAAMYLALAAGLGLVASLGAIPVAAVAGRAYAGVKADLLNFDVTGYAIPAWVILLQVLVGMAVPVIAAALPVRQAARMSVASALRDVGISPDGRDTGEPWLARRGGVSRAILFSVRNAFRRRQRMALTLLAIATGGAVYLGARNLRVAVRGSLDLVFASQQYDVSLRLATPQTPDSTESIVRGVAGVQGAEGWGAARANAPHADSTVGNIFSIAAPPLGSRLFVATPTAGRWLVASDTNALVVTRSLQLQEPSLQVGTTVDLTIGGRTGPWEVVGLIDGGPAPTAWTTRDVLARRTGNARISSVMVATGPGGLATQVDLIQRARSALDAAGMPVGSSQLLSENRRVMEDHLLMVVDFLGVMAWVMITVGGMGLASTMGLAVLERTREIGVLRAIGANHGAILTMIEVEGLVVALLGWLVALPLSIPMSVALGEAFGRVMFRVPLILVPEASGVWRWLVVVVAVSVVACAWPALRATRGTIARALAYE